MREKSMQRIVVLTVCLACFSCATSLASAGEKSAKSKSEKPHVVFVVGTPHYEPGTTLPPLAGQLAENFDFRVTVVMPEGNPEKSEEGIEGLEVLADADVAVFFLRFLTLPEDQLKHILDYVTSGKPVIGLRTSTHAFIYPEGHHLAKWNNGFGRDVLGSQYYLHMQGTTEVRQVAAAKGHPILTGLPTEPVTAAGSLYRAELPKDATALLTGTGKPKKPGTVTNMFGTHELKPVETSVVAWVWKNPFGGTVFTTTLGHPGTFESEWMVRLAINAIHWAAGKPVPAPSVEVTPIVPK